MKIKVECLEPRHYLFVEQLPGKMCPLVVVERDVYVAKHGKQIGTEDVAKALEDRQTAAEFKWLFVEKLEQAMLTKVLTAFDEG